MRRYLLTLSCFVLAGIVGLGLLSAYRFWILRDSTKRTRASVSW